MHKHRTGLFGVGGISFASRVVGGPASTWALFALALLLPAAGLASPQPVVFVSRDLSNLSPDRTQRTSAVDAARSGQLILLGIDGSRTVLVDGKAPGALVTDVTDPDVSHDAQRIVFSGFSTSDRAFRIFEINADGTGLHQITQSDRSLDPSRYGAAWERLSTYDDTDPCYLPDGRICFSSTRYPGIAPDNRLRTTNLYVVGTDGSGLHRITSERFGADTPVVNPSTGQITYSRWWRTPELNTSNITEPIPPGSPGYGDVASDPERPIQNSVLRGINEEDFPGVNNWFLASINPDGTGMGMQSGFRLDRELTQAWKPSYMADGSVLALFIPQTPLLGTPGSNGLRRFVSGPSRPTFLGGPQSFNGSGFLGGPRGDPMPMPPAPPMNVFFFYASAVATPDGRFLVTGTPSPGSRDLGVYLQENGDVQPAPLIDLPGTAEQDAVLLLPRPVPPVIEEKVTNILLEDTPASVEEAAAQAGTFTFRVDNIHFNAPVNVPIPNAPPIGRNLSIEFFMAPQRTGVTSADPAILIRSVEIPSDGKVEVDLPAGVPLFEVLRRPDGTIPIGRDGQIFHVGGMNFNRENQKGGCVGCHAGHSMLELPEDPSWTNLAPSAVVTASSSRDGFDNSGAPIFRPQAVVDRRTDAPAFVWAAGQQPQPVTQIRLQWTIPLRAKEAVLHGIPAGVPGMTTNQQITAFTVITLLGDAPQQTIEVSYAVSPEGTHVALDPSLEFDGLQVVINTVTGLFEGSPAPALGEIEVIAKVSSADSEPSVIFVRGDVDCEGHVNITDAVSTLNTLFLGGPAFCCGTAADANDDQTINLTDAVHLLNHLFRGGVPPADPFPNCGRGTEGPFVCDVEACPAL